MTSLNDPSNADTQVNDSPNVDTQVDEWPNVDIQDLHTNLRSARSVKTALASKKKDKTFTFYELQITTGVATNIRQSLIYSLEQTQNGTVQDYEFGYRLGQEELGCVRNYANNPLATKIITDASNFGNMQPTPDSLSNIKNLKYYATVVVFDSGEHAVFFKQLTQRLSLNPQRTKLLFRMRTGNYQKFDSFQHDLLVLDTGFDCFIWRGNIYVTHQRHFNWIFGFYKTYKQESQQIATTLMDKVPCPHSRKIIDLSGRVPAMMSKLKQIHESGQLDTLDINKFMEINARAGWDFSLTPDQNQVDFDPTIKNIWRFLYIASDEIAKALLSERIIRTNSSVPV